MAGWGVGAVVLWGWPPYLGKGPPPPPARAVATDSPAAAVARTRDARRERTRRIFTACAPVRPSPRCEEARPIVGTSVVDASISEPRPATRPGAEAKPAPSGRDEGQFHLKAD